MVTTPGLARQRTLIPVLADTHHTRRLLSTYHRARGDPARGARRSHRRLATLPVRRREAIVLRYWLELSEREIAQTMGISTGTVKSQVSRGLAALAQALEAKA